MAEADKRLAGRYERILVQLEELYEKTDNLIARMATTVAVLHHKMPHYFWTGFYRVMGEELVVGPYQGPLACSVLSGGSGVCFACLKRREPIVVPDVDAFEGHIACDSRSKSEVVIPLFDEEGRVIGVLDVDAKKKDAFRQSDVDGLLPIVERLVSGTR